MLTDHKLDARNAEEIELVAILERGADRLMKNLGLTGVTLRCERMGGWAGADAFHAGSYECKRKLIKINFRNLYGESVSTFLRVLGHEFRHAEQHANGWLTDKKWENPWKGPEVETVDNSSPFHKLYYKQPQEVDARNYEAAYGVIAGQGEREFVVPGERAMREDRAATYAKYGVTRDETCVFEDRDGKFTYMTIDQLAPFSKKTPTAWTGKFMKMAWEHRDLMWDWTPVLVPVTISDLVV